LEKYPDIMKPCSHSSYFDASDAVEKDGRRPEIAGQAASDAVISGFSCGTYNISSYPAFAVQGSNEASFWA
jgi:hypothetical protein